MTKYNQEIESKMRQYYSQLNEKDKRHYVAQEALKLGFGGKTYIRQLFGISDYLIRQGIAELENKSIIEEIPKGKLRSVGGGRKKKN